MGNHQRNRCIACHVLKRCAGIIVFWAKIIGLMGTASGGIIENLLPRKSRDAPTGIAALCCYGDPLS
jgi:hypothetical protein